MEQGVFDAAIKNSEKRCQKIDYQQAAEGDFAFQTSAQALLDWAPVIDDFKKNDELIVRNSIHLRWISVRRDLSKGLQTEAVLAKSLKKRVTSPSPQLISQLNRLNHICSFFRYHYGRGMSVARGDNRHNGGICNTHTP